MLKLKIGQSLVIGKIATKFQGPGLKELNSDNKTNTEEVIKPDLNVDKSKVKAK